MLNRSHSSFNHRIWLHAQLVLHVNRASSDKGMNTAIGGILQRFGSTVDVGGFGACQGTDGRLPDGVGNGFDCFEITLTGDSKTGFDHVYLEALKGSGDTQFLVAVHGGAGALLAVTQGGVKNDQLVFFHALSLI